MRRLQAGHRGRPGKVSGILITEIFVLDIFAELALLGSPGHDGREKGVPWMDAPSRKQSLLCEDVLKGQLSKYRICQDGN